MRVVVARSMRVYTTYDVDGVPEAFRELLDEGSDGTEDQELASELALWLFLHYGPVGDDEVGDEADEPDYNIWTEED